VAVALAGALVAAACSGGGGEADRSTSTSAALGPVLTSTTLQGPDLVVSEQGVTSFPDPYDADQRLGGYGVVLQNPDPTLLAAGVRVTTRILDATGQQLLADTALLNGIMPGQRMAVGRTIVEPIGVPASLHVEVDVGAWMEPAAGTAPVTVSDALTEPEPDGGAVTHFALRPGGSIPEDGVDVAALYRAADGHLLSVETTTIDQLVPGTTTVGQIRLLAPIPDLASTEVLAGRGFSAQITG
jgi:hypothetical protein